MYLITSQFSKFYQLQDKAYLTDSRYQLLKQWLKETNQVHSTHWLIGEDINYALILEFDKYLKSINKKHI